MKASETPPSVSRSRVLRDSAHCAGVALVTLGLLAAIFAYYWWTWRTLDGFVRAIDHGPFLFQDFTEHYYPASKIVFSGELPPGGDFYGAFFTLLCWPITLAPLDVAVRIWIGLQALVLLGLLAVPGLNFLRRARWDFYLYAALLASCVPVLHNFKWGQMSVAITLSALAAVWAYQRNHRIAAAMALALGAAIKYYTGIFIVYFLLKKDYRFVAAFVITGIVLHQGVPAAALGLTRTADLSLRASQVFAQGNMTPARIVNSQSGPNVAYRLFNLNPYRPDVSMPMVLAGLTVVAANLMCVRRVIQRNLPNGLEWSAVLFFLSIPFFIKQSWVHYFVYLPFCQVFLYRELRRGFRRELPTIELVLLLIPSVILSNILLFNLIGWVEYIFDGLVFFSDALLLVLCYLQLAARFRGQSLRAEVLARRKTAGRNRT